jgi:hypothetical protein
MRQRQNDKSFPRQTAQLSVLGEQLSDQRKSAVTMFGNPFSL